MATSSDNPPAQQSDAIACVKPHKGRTWFPILLGVLCGMIVGRLFEKPFEHFMVRRFEESYPQGLYTPVYDLLLYILTSAAGGGFIGVLFSRWSKGTAFWFLFATLVVIVITYFMGLYYAYWSLYPQSFHLPV